MKKTNYVIDAGANLGLITTRMALMIKHKPYGRVYAFEPSKYAYEFLVKNVNRNRLRNYVETFRIALSDRIYRTQFHHQQASAVSSLKHN